MKNLFLMIAIVSIVSLSACGQANKEVPANIKTAFSQKFPNATKVKWEMENEKEWEAEFKMDGKEYSANFDINATWLETEYEISSKEVPSVIKTEIEREYADYKMKESEISETAEGKVYEFELKKEGSVLEVAFDLNGKVIKKEEKKGKEDND